MCGMGEDARDLFVLDMKRDNSDGESKEMVIRCGK